MRHENVNTYENRNKKRTLKTIQAMKTHLYTYTKTKP